MSYFLALKQECQKKKRKLPNITTRYTVRLSLNLIGLEDLKLNSRNEQQTFHKVA